MESGTHVSLRTAAIQRRNEELEQILAAAAGVGNILSVIREGTHEGPTHSAGNTLLTPISFVPSKAQEHGGDTKQLPLRTISVSLETLAIQKKNMELEKQIVALQVKAPKEGELSVHSLELKQRNEEIQRRLAQLDRNSTGCRIPATQALYQRNQELEQRLLLAETSMKRALDTADRERTRKISLRACELEKMMTRAQELDLVFLVDATSSMQFYIDLVKHKVVDIANGIRGVHTQLTLRVAFAPYRDYAERVDDDYDTCDFTSSFDGEGSTFIKALTRVKTFGGWDDAEDVFSGLERVTKLSWRATTRVLVHIADAPCHGLQFHNESVGDYYPEGDLWRRNIGCLLKYLQNDCQITSYLFCHINDSTRKMIHEFKRYTARPGSRPWIEEQLLTNVDNLVQTIVKNACSTISQTMSTSVPR